MNDLFPGFEFICAYIDGILVLTKVHCVDHVQKLELTLSKLKGKYLKCNIEKYFFGQTKTEHLGFWVSHDGVKPMDNRIQAMQNMNPHT